MDFLTQLTDPYLKTLWIIALAASLIFIVQSLFTFVGFDNGEDFDTDLEVSGAHDSFHWFTFRNLVNFLLGFGWTSIALYHVINDSFLVAILAVGVGAFMVWMFFWISMRLQDLAQDNTMRIRDAIGQVGHVYLHIPSQKSGRGKLHITIQNTLRELDAITEGDSIPTGSSARVVDIIDNQLLMVERE